MLELERTAAGHWRGTEEEWLGAWLLRAADGFTGRANSALPLGDPGVPLDEALDYVTGWYRARGLPAMIAVPLPLPPTLALPPTFALPSASPVSPASSAGDSHGGGLDARLSERSWATRPGPAFVMVADLPLAVAVGELPAGAAITADADPDQAWLARYHYRGTDTQPPVMSDVLTSAQAQAFISIRTGSDVLAIARLSIADGWAGLTAVEVNPNHRRAGLGTAITAAACAEAAARGVRRVFLQVEEGNAGARALYQGCGFRYSHRYHYRMAPP
jgi:N-acetylglutamate synthase